jgi:hypothetical protein
MHAFGVVLTAWFSKALPQYRRAPGGTLDLECAAMLEQNEFGNCTQLLIVTCHMY